MEKEPLANPLDLLLPYQRAWVKDTSRFKIGLMSRQVGKSLGAAFEVVLDAMETGQDWIVLSAGERQAKEFIAKVARVAEILGEALIASTGYDSNAQALSEEVRFANGARVIGLPANPNTARGYSANLVLDEFAFHENPEAIWRAVFPIVTNPLKGKLKLRIISTPAGKNNQFYSLWSGENLTDSTNTEFQWSKHKVDVYQAVQQGLDLDVQGLRAALDDEDGFRQEYLCEFLESASQFLSTELATQATHKDADQYGKPILQGQVFVGVDIGRSNDLTVCWTLETHPSLDGVFWTREVLTLQNMPYAEQQALISDRIKQANRCAIDATGIGDETGERLTARFGEHKIEACKFTAPFKEEIFGRLKSQMEQNNVRIPDCPIIRKDLTSLQKQITPGGTVRFVAARTKDGHSDRANALALAIYAARGAATCSPEAYREIFVPRNEFFSAPVKF